MIHGKDAIAEAAKVTTDDTRFNTLVQCGVEFGYTIFPPFRRQGYATETSRALMNWAQQQGVSRFTLTISPENQPSLRIAAQLGFVKIGSQIDEEDGLEEIYDRSFGTNEE